MSADRQHLEPRAADALDRLKYEVAAEIGLTDDIAQRGWENMTTREVGKIGGNMVKRMVRYAEQAMAAGADLDKEQARRLDE